MKIEIWSDVMCPFCYIGKRHFEKALAQFEHGDTVQIEWRSFQLDPDLQAQPGKTVYAYLAERKGMSIEQSKQMHANVVAMAARAGLRYDFDRAVIGNSFDAHRLSHLAAQHGKQDAFEERMFAAYFTEGEDIANHETLIRLGTSCGLDEAEMRAVLNSDTYADAVRNDQEEAYKVGARGVPFFVIDRRYAVSGAQPAESFLQALQQAWTESHPKPVGTDGDVCAPGEDCTTS